MLKLWIFVLLIDGQPLEAIQSDTEASCKHIMTLLLTSQRLAGKKASGACYVKTSENL